ncbi:alkylated DNA nucleotide flippase Atl1 [Tahibacter aquaticus]|uniref:Alkylated DNA nucleotide flippase Atl1 n=1 Tax=Tahibacter aquaticus TaxID=520092 RepID=A0A4R6Z9K4_9GAMM|nr:alkylated DNA nucleotide flippase Atl1 [Tahibacter aquaticus]
MTAATDAAYGVRGVAKQDLTAGAAKAIAAPVGDEAAAAIWATIQRIPRGNVCSYGEIATRAGLPGRARLVGKVLGQVPDGMAVPWFRVLRSDGRIAFPPQSKAYREQRARLLEEGVRVERGKVKLQDFGWGRNLDRDIWAPPPEPVRTVAKTAKKRVDAPADRAAKTTGTTPAKSARARR